jgi:hypothetical protein
MRPSRQYRDFLRTGCRLFMEPQYAALLQGTLISYLRLADLEALYELIFGCRPPSRVGGGIA